MSISVSFLCKYSKNIQSTVSQIKKTHLNGYILSLVPTVVMASSFLRRAPNKKIPFSSCLLSITPYILTP